MDFKINLDLNALESFFGPMHEKQKAYMDIVETKRLILRREPTPDIVSTVYSILLKESQQKIGEVTLIFDGEIWYKVYQPFRKKGYATEAVSKLIEISKENEFFLRIDSTNIASKKVAKKLGFTRERKDRKTWTFIKK